MEALRGFCRRGALRLTKKLGFSVRCARPVPYNCATPEKQDEYVCETIKMLKKYDSEHYKVVCVVWTAVQTVGPCL